MGSAGPLILCSALVAGALVVRGDRARAWLLLGALLLAPAILLVHVADSDQVRTLRDHPAAGVAAGVLGLARVGARAAGLARRLPGACGSPGMGRPPTTPKGASRAGSPCRWTTPAGRRRASLPRSSCASRLRRS
jgi:hypothetical protein